MTFETSQDDYIRKLVATLRRVWKWADDHADIKSNGEANDAMIVKDMIEDELGGKP
jgi:hypothetical protein